MTNIASLPDRAGGFVPKRLIEARIARRMARSELAKLIGISGQAIAYYEAGERRPDMSMVIKFSMALGRSPGFFLHDGPPFGSSVAARFFRSTGHRSNRLNHSLDIRLKWLWEIVSYVKGMARLPEPNVPQPSLEIGDGYLFPEIEYLATQTRRHWGLGDGPIANMVALLETHGVIVSRFSMGAERVDAFSSWVSSCPYIVLGAGKHSAVRSRFDAAHELAHLILHREITQQDLETPKVRARVEKEANQFAGAFLLPRSSLLGEFYSTRLNHLTGLKERWRVSMQAIAHRAMQIGALDEDQYINFRKQMSEKKWLTLEPLDDTIPFEEPSLLKKAWNLVIQAGRTTSIVELELGLGSELIAEVAGLSLPPLPPVPEPILRRL